MRLRTIIATSLGATLVAVTAWIGIPADAASALIIFYEGNGASKDVVCSIAVPATGPMTVRQIDFTNNPFSCKNDEVRSMRFAGSTAGLTVEVWDRSSCANPVGQSRSDFSITDQASSINSVVVPTFEANVQVRGFPYAEAYFRSNGNLDGKVSCVRISRSR